MVTLCFLFSVQKFLFPLNLVKINMSVQINYAKVIEKMNENKRTEKTLNPQK